MLWIGIALGLGLVLLLLVRSLAFRPSMATSGANEVLMSREPSATGSPRRASPAHPSPALSTAPTISYPPGPRSPEEEASTEGEGFDVPVEPEFEADEGPQPPSLVVTAQGRSHPGRSRKHNEDAFLLLPEHDVFAVADGMGGYVAGEIASQMAVDAIRQAFERRQFDGEPDPVWPRLGEELVRTIRMANAAVFAQSRANHAQAGMGTTVVCCRFSRARRRVFIAHVGDSRCYRLRNGRLRQMTVDHTLGAVGVTGPSAGKLSRAVGILEHVQVDLVVDRTAPSDLYILCSDGLSKMLSDQMIGDIVRHEQELDRAADRLIQAANDRGGRDNVTVVLIRVDQPGTG